MSALLSLPRRAFAWLIRHSVTGLNVIAMGMLAVIVVLAGSGLLLTPAAPANTTSTTSTTTTTTPSPVILDASPASAILAAVIDQLGRVSGFTATTPSFSTADPLLAGCASGNIPVAQMARSRTLVAASLEVVVNVSVYGAGLGARVVARTLRATTACAGDYVQSYAPVGLDGFIASSIDVAGSSIFEVTARVGDVVFSLYGFPTAYQSASTPTLALAGLVSSDLTPAMATVCADEHADVSAARRNPTQSDYVPYALPIVVTPPVAVPLPNLSLLYGPLPVVPAPVPGSITSAPVAPSVPKVALTTAVLKPTKDLVGPGCGWAFTAMVRPAVPRITVPLKVQIAAATAKLERTWTHWPAAVSAYLQAKAVYVRDLASYNATTTTTTSSTTTTTAPPPTTTTPPVTSTTTTLVTTTTGATPPPLG